MKVIDLQKQSATVTSTASITLGAALDKCRTVAQAAAAGDITVGATDVGFIVRNPATGAYEAGLYTITSATQLTRTKVYGSPVNFGGATVEVYSAVPAAAVNAFLSATDGVTGSQLTSIATVAKLLAIDSSGNIGVASANAVSAFLSGSNNSTSGDTTAPTVTAATVLNSAPTIVVLSMSEAMDATNVPPASAWTIPGHTVQSVSIGGANNTTISLTVTAAFVNGEAARVVNYTPPGTGYARDVAGNALAAIQNQPITNNVAVASDTVAPTFSSAQVTNSAPTVIILTFNENLSSSTPPTSAFSVSGGRTVTAVGAPSGATVAVTVNTAYAYGDVITVGYTKPSANPRLQDAAGNAVETFTGKTVTNGVGAAPGVKQYPRMVDLTGSNASETGPAPYDYVTNYNGFMSGLFDLGFVSGQDGWITFEPDPNTSRVIQFGLTTAKAPNVNGMAYGLDMDYVGNSDGYRVWVNGSTANTKLANRNAGDIVKISITAGTLKFEVSKDSGSTWTLMQSIPNVTGSYKIQAISQYGSVNNITSMGLA